MAEHPMRGRISGGGAQGKGEEIEDEKLAREEKAAANQVRRRVGLGLGALADKGDDEEVEIINASLKRVHYSTYAGKKGQHRVDHVIEPFGSAKLKVRKARQLMQDKRRGKYIFVAPPKGDCGGKESFEAFGQRFETCSYRECPRHPAPRPGAAWSVMVAQHVVASRETEPAIRRVVEHYDPRAPVQAWGWRILQVRQDQKRQRMGLVGTGDVSGREQRLRRAVS